MGNHNDMPVNVLVDIFDNIIDAAGSNPDITYDCQLHGGEPMQYKSLDVVIEQLQRTKKYKNIRWCITTNLVYKLNDQIFEIFDLMVPFGNDQKFIQTSWDYNIRFDNDAQLKLWVNNVKTLINNNINVQPTVCLTNQLISHMTGKQVIDYFLNLGISHLNFERITNTGRAVDNKLRPLNCDLDHWLLEAYKYYEKVGDRITIELFAGVQASLHGQMIGCRARHCMENVITYNPDGSVAGCPNTAYNPYKNADGRYDKQTHVMWIKQERFRHNSCMLCEYYRYCNGDCFQLQFDQTGCSGMRSIYQYLISKE